MIPANFTFVIDPLPPIAAVAVCVVVARVAALIAAWRTARMSPVTAFGEAADKPARLSPFRLATGYLLLAAGTAAAIALPSQSDATFILDAVLLVYVMIAVVNSLVTATAARAREFELLRLIGATRRQVRAMMRRETLILVAAAVIVGSLIALPPLIGVSAGVTRHLVPSIPPLEYLAIVAVVAALGWFSIMIPARLAMRSRTAGVLNSRQG
jgi:ABC-type antimicrobial peptide transport system permease subunit